MGVLRQRSEIPEKLERCPSRLVTRSTLVTTSPLLLTGCPVLVKPCSSIRRVSCDDETMSAPRLPRFVVVISEERETVPRRTPYIIPNRVVVTIGTPLPLRR